MTSILRARAPLYRGVLTARTNLARAPVRKFTTPTGSTPPPKSGNGLYIGLGIGAVALAGGVFYVSSTNEDAGTAAKSAIPTGKVASNFAPTKEDYQRVYNKIASILDAENYDDGSYGPVLVRLAWHSSGTYDKETNTGGSNYATMRFNPEALHGANAGLDVARALMEQVKKEYPWISYGDLWTLAGVAAIQEAQGPKIPWRAGRIDGLEKDVTPDGRLPDAAQGQDHLRQIFYRMGFNDQEIVALAGAHALGRCHPDRSGFEGPWTFSPTTFTNAFFSLLLSEKWNWRKWNGPKQLQDKKTGSLMMLPADYALVQDKSFKQWVKKYAQDESLFFQDFALAFHKLLELGVPASQWATPQAWELKTLDEQEAK
ncbi:cytochrome c peroxidase [Gautieria morchelliformis]|nr:cytochrome c peroxidase [Gautieria morchelliformis]